jgi:ABC-2 type transport system permease protein
MKLLLQVAGFELGYYLRRGSTWIYFGLFFVLSVLLIAGIGGAFSGLRLNLGGAGGKVLVNAPYVVTVIICTLSLFCVLVTAALAGNAGYRDFGTGMHPLVYSTPVPRSALLGGRYLATVLLNLLVYGGIGLGVWLGSFGPWLDRESFGPTVAGGYVQAYLYFILPNVMLVSAVFYGLAALTRKILPNYLGGVILLVGYLLSGTLARDPGSRWVASLIDPFGLRALQQATVYWTQVERNGELLSFSGVILYNRLIWLGVTALLAFVVYRRFRFGHAAVRGRRAARAQDEPPAAGRDSAAAGEAAAPLVRRHGAGARWAQLAAMTGRAIKEVVTNVYFYAIVVAGLVFLIPAAQQVGRLYGTYTWPVTYQVLEMLGGTFSLFVLIVITFFTGEMVWRERDLRVNQLVDSQPVPDWVPYLAKLAALGVVVVLLLATVMLAGMLTQELKGYHNYEVGLYAKTLFGMYLPDYLLICVLALAVHVVVNHKYLGHLFVVLYYVTSLVLSPLGLEHGLYNYGSDATVLYSDMNGFGPYLRPFIWFKLYWAAFALLLALLSTLLWVRGEERGWRRRLRLARARLSWRIKVLAAAALAAFCGLGAYIFYNTNVLNTYRTSWEQEVLQARYEKRYKHRAKLPQPRITAVKLDVAIYPARQECRIKGRYTLRNKTGKPIPELLLRVDPELQIKKLALNRPASIKRDDRELGFRVYRLRTPLLPGDEARLTFDLLRPRRGFPNRVKAMVHTSVAENGTFLHSPDITPGIGYWDQYELQNDRRRKKHGLEARARLPEASDLAARANNYITPDSDWIDFEATLSTSADQIAIAPGNLIKKWTAGGRRHFRYRMDRPILGFYPVLSARYAVYRGRHGDVPIEIYHHPGHRYNLRRMVEGVKASLAYFTKHFGPYQHRLVRIVEFPRYAAFAQSFPNTIPYSESIGFIARIGEDDIDYPFYVTAHEVAHQWWAHQAIGGKVRGATMLSETLAQYSALMVMEQAYGKEKMRRFLRYELDRYLRGRGGERKQEYPLIDVEQQGYIHYNKGSLVMYRLRDAIGEDALNRALSGFLARVKFQQPPYTTSRELLRALREVTPAEQRYILKDCFETITLHENRAVKASWHKVKKDRYRVTLEVSARKLRVDGEGNEKEVPIDDQIDVGVFGADKELLLLEKRRVTSRRQVFSLTVKAKPERAGIDPHNKLIDRHPDDNVIAVEQGEPSS